MFSDKAAYLGLIYAHHVLKLMPFSVATFFITGRWHLYQQTQGPINLYVIELVTGQMFMSTHSGNDCRIDLDLDHHIAGASCNDKEFV